MAAWVKEEHDRGQDGRGSENDGNLAFEAMHRELDKVWGELYRVLKPGSFACINIGDATRSIGDRFQRYPNHTRIQDRSREGGKNEKFVLLGRTE